LSVDADASKCTASGRVPDFGDAANAAVGGLSVWVWKDQEYALAKVWPDVSLADLIRTTYFVADARCDLGAILRVRPLREDVVATDFPAAVVSV
jgi:hypothetical protein